MPAAPVCSSTALAWAGVVMSPLAITGMASRHYLGNGAVFNGAVEAAGPRAAVHSEGRNPGLLGHFGNVDGVATVKAPASANFQGNRRGHCGHYGVEYVCDQLFISQQCRACSAVADFLAGQPMLISTICC